MLLSAVEIYRELRAVEFSIVASVGHPQEVTVSIRDLF